MPKIIKKPPIKPEKRLEWLKRNEQGETPPKIAEADNIDVRTVRKHVELARMERDVQHARSEVLRNALEGHYRDLLETAEGINTDISKSILVSLEQPLMLGLRQHMPRSPLWENLRKWNRTVNEIVELEGVLPDKIRRMLKTDGRLDGIVSHGAAGVVAAAVDALTHQVKAWAHGWSGLEMDGDIHVEKTAEGGVRMRYGAFSFGGLEEEGSVGTIKAVLADIESKLKPSPEHLELEKLYGRLQRLGIAIRDVLTVIRLRRIVTGKCKYCPL